MPIHDPRRDDLFAPFSGALLSLDPLTARDALSACRDRGGDWTALPSAAMEFVGRGWETGEHSLAQVYMAGRIGEELLDEFLPPEGRKPRPAPRTAIAVLEDRHMLGKRVVASMLRASGFALEDFGATDTASLAGRAAADGIEVLLVSTLMLTSALKVRELRARLDRLRPGVKIMVGGAPFLFDRALWQEVGADAMGASPAEAAAFLARAGEMAA